jgi:Ca2+-binding RTX toxin-like protein
VRISHWLIRLQNRRPARKTNRRVPQQTTESLEQRTLLTTVGILTGPTDLTIFVDDGDSATVQRNQTTGNVEVLDANGQPYQSIPSIQASLLTSLNIFADDADNTLSVAPVTASEFSALSTIVIDAGDGDDVITGSDDFADSIDGGDGNDIITGGGGNDTLDAGDGNDLVTGGAGPDSILGGNGQDTINGGSGNDNIDAGDGQDLVNGGTGDDTINAGDGLDTVNGGAGADSINGMSGADLLNGDADNDTILGGSENDIVNGGDGNDIVNGQAGNDTVSGDAGDDTAYGGGGRDSLLGSAGNDIVNGQSGNDTLLGGDGDDRVYGGRGSDSLDGEAGDDTVLGHSGNDILSGGGGSDSVVGGSGDDLLLSGGGSTSPLIVIDNVTMDEGDSGTTAFNFTVSLSVASTTTITVDYSTVDGAATAPGDYTAVVTDTLTFLPGVTTQIATINVVGDTSVESTETFTVVLSNPMGAVISDATGLGVINDDDTNTTPLSAVDALAAATSYLEENASEFGLTLDDVQNFAVTSQHGNDHNGVTHIYLRQTYQGLQIVDADINLNVAADGSILSVYNSFVSDVASLGLSATPARTVDQVFSTLGGELGEVLEDGHGHGHSHGSSFGETEEVHEGEELTLVRTEIPDRLQWVKTDDGSLELVWTINVQEGISGWYDASASATNGEVLHNVSYTAHATYNVFQYTLEGPLYGGRTLEIDPQDSVASPFGWHDTDGVAGAEFTDTRGNNVFAQEDANADNMGGTRPDGGAGLVFDFPFDDTMAPTTYTAAATTNLFYANNIIHDVLYQYGFDEASGNFQLNNYGNGGLGGDPVQADAQDGSGFNNANFGTPPDGFAPRMQQFIFNLTNPNRDSSVENAIIYHEYGHGVSNRLTGGGANSGALNCLQSRGMGEGWSDYFSLIMTQQIGDAANDARGVGNYVLGQGQNGGGIRSFPYSFDMTVNPLTLDDANTRLPTGVPHPVGEIWATALWDMTWLLIDGIATPDSNGNTTPGYGYDPDLYNGTGGNNIALQLVIDGMKLQPANPSLIDARDAIIQADIINNGGANLRAITTAFGRRGFGFSASTAGCNSTTVTAAFDLPPEVATIQFETLNYASGDAVMVRVSDGDLPMATTNVMVTVTSSGGDTEMVTLNRQVDGTFLGSIALQSGSAIANNGFIEAGAEAGLLTASYLDVSNLSGSPITVQALASVTDPQGDTLRGGDGEDTIIANAGDDLIDGDAGDDSIRGEAGNDTIDGGDGNDTIDGGAGDDTIAGQSGDDVITGGAGIDNVVWNGVGNGSDTILASDGAETLTVQGDSGVNNYTVSSNSGLLRVAEGAASITVATSTTTINVNGGSDNDVITITSLADVNPLVLNIDGQADNDTITAVDANIGKVRLFLNGGTGNDTITGSRDGDSINGDGGDDLVFGGLGNDSVDGGDGNDTLNGDAGNDFLFGNLGNDLMDGGIGNDLVSGGLGNDTAIGGEGDDTLLGGFGDDVLNGNSGNDLADGGRDNDQVLGGSGDDSLKGGTGDDTIRGQSGDDLIKGGDGNDNIRGDAGNDIVDGGDGDDDVDAGNGNDIVAGGDGNDTLNGMSGADTLLGGNGNDNQLGGAGIDSLYGEEGDDSLNGGSSIDQFNGGEGVDVLVDPDAGEVDNNSLAIEVSVMQALALLNGF